MVLNLSLQMFLRVRSNLNNYFMLNFQFLELGREIRPAPVKQDPITLGAAGIMAGTSLLGSLLGFTSQSDTNSQQQAMMREQMEFQREENEKQRQENQLNRDWSEMMWNKENEYNSPSAMMARYKEAGLNPFLAGGETAIGAAGSPSSPSMNGLVGQGSVPSLHAPMMDLNSPVQAFLQAEGVNANIANQRAETIKTLWETDQYIRYHFGNDASKQFRDAHPEMVGDDDPDKSPFMKQYYRSAMRDDIRNEMLKSEQWLLDRYGSQEHEMALREGQERVNKLASDVSMNEQKIKESAQNILESLARVGFLRKQGDYYVSQTETANQIRQYLVSAYKDKSIILNHAQQMDTVYFENAEELSGWLTSKEGKHVRAEIERIYGKRRADALWTAGKDFFDIIGKIRGVDGYTRSSMSGRSGMDYDGSVDQYGQSSTDFNW